MASANPIGKDPKPHSESIAAALKVLDDIGQAGLAVTPLEPTAEMVAAGMRIGGVTEAQVLAIYFAMLSAAAEE